MIRYSLAAAIALATMTGAVLAQTSSSVTSTQSTTSSPAPSAASVSSSRQTTDSNGVVTDETQTFTSGTTLAPVAPGSDDPEDNRNHHDPLATWFAATGRRAPNDRECGERGRPKLNSYDHFTQISGVK